MIFISMNLNAEIAGSPVANYAEGAEGEKYFASSA